MTKAGAACKEGVTKVTTEIQGYCGGASTEGQGCFSGASEQVGRMFFAYKNNILAKKLSVRAGKVTLNCKFSVVSVRPCVRAICRKVFKNAIPEMCWKRQKNDFSPRQNFDLV